MAMRRGNGDENSRSHYPAATLSLQAHDYTTDTSAHISDSDDSSSFAPSSSASQDTTSSSSQANVESRYETLDYDTIDNYLYKQERLRRTAHIENLESMAKWVITGLVGLLTGTFAFVIDLSVKKLMAWKFSTTLTLLSGHGLMVSFFVFLAINMGMVFISSMCVAYGEPLAGGSGIPEVKGYLNGTNIRRLLRIRTLIAKVVGVTFSVAGGLAVGKEGPLVHTGAVLAAHMSQGGKKFRYRTKWLRGLRNDHYKRDFISGGSAAGVAAAFGAPVGGVLFSLEEASSFWSLDLTWRTLLCSMLSSFALNFFLSGAKGDMSQPGLITFGVTAGGYKLWELVPYFLLAIIGGFLGALFTAINLWLCRIRKNYINRLRWARVLEALFICLLTTLPAFWGSYYSICRVSDQGDGILHRSRFNCPKGEYSDIATLFFSSQEDAIRAMFHSGEDFHWQTLAVFGGCYYVLAIITYGSAVPSGLFVPSILAGASYGRLFGQLLTYLLPDASIHPGSYALIGASGMLGGVCRMTISLTVILLETTNDVQFLFPIFMTLFVSKLVGDTFNESLYDLHVHLKEVPFLPNEPTKAMEFMTAKDVMVQDVVTLEEQEKVSKIVHVLNTTTHNGFPIVNRCRSGNGRTFAGIVLRSQLLFLLKYREFERIKRPEKFHRTPKKTRAHFLATSYESERTRLLASEDDAELPSSNLRWLDFSTTVAKDIPRVESLQLSTDEMHRTVDLRRYMHSSPYIVQQSCPLSRVFRLFRTMGLRHLPVVDSHSEIVGFITRKDLLESHVDQRLDELLEEERASDRQPRSLFSQRSELNEYHAHGTWSAVSVFQEIQEQARLNSM